MIMKMPLMFIDAVSRVVQGHQLAANYLTPPLLLLQSKCRLPWCWRLAIMALHAEAKVLLQWAILRCRSRPLQLATACCSSDVSSCYVAANTGEDSWVVPGPKECQRWLLSSDSAMLWLQRRGMRRRRWRPASWRSSSSCRSCRLLWLSSWLAAWAAIGSAWCWTGPPAQACRSWSCLHCSAAPHLW